MMGANDVGPAIATRGRLSKTTLRYDTRSLHNGFVVDPTAASLHETALKPPMKGTLPQVKISMPDYASDTVPEC
jgi:hypothetical protein